MQKRDSLHKAKPESWRESSARMELRRCKAPAEQVSPRDWTEPAERMVTMG